MVTAFIFPGQGSQKVGMGRAWAEESPAARVAFAEADEALGFALSRLCWEGPEEELQLTANTQPAILTVSVAAWRAAAEAGLAPQVVAGHSLGEYSALVAAGALTFADALRLVRRRGELMQEAVPVGVGAMAAVIGLPAAEVELIARQAADDEVCAVANYNAPIQTVVAGHRPAVERAVELARERGAKRALLLPVSAPFHCELMRPARQALTPLLEATQFHDPQVPVMTNVDAAPVTTVAAARQALARQVDSPVRWVASIERMIAEHSVERFLEVGPGAVLTGLMRRIARGVETASLAEPAALEGMLAAAKEERS
ncbi:MAG: ACP S-malonyltransferase [Thermoanaerobaculia bacterium]